jgi:hypothetical protein
LFAPHKHCPAKVHQCLELSSWVVDNSTAALHLCRNFAFRSRRCCNSSYSLSFPGGHGVLRPSVWRTGCSQHHLHADLNAFQDRNVYRFRRFQHRQAFMHTQFRFYLRTLPNLRSTAIW